MSYTPLPIGIDDFSKIIEKKCYYVDKTNLIKELLDQGGEVNLFTRPRRFGKTLNLSMLKYFFEKPLDGKSRKHLFDGLNIMKAGEVYTSKQEQYPVIMLTLKSAKQPTYEMAYKSMIEDISYEYERYVQVLQSDKLSTANKEKFKAIRDRKADVIDYAKSLAFLSKCLYEVYQKEVIILIDEYDVPLENAYDSGFYDEMITFICSLFESALKTNPYLEFSVITGCLRISKESIFTGLNNLKIISILNEDYGEYFGFVEEEVSHMLKNYGLEAKMDTMKDWYDGYQFGNTEVYNPWSVINYIDSLRADEDAFPTAAWSNTSSNSIVKDMILRASQGTRQEIEALIQGETIEKKVHEDITYEDIDQSEENLWNFLFFTGYLKKVSKKMVEDEIYIKLAIPNKEVRLIYRNHIRNWFQEKVQAEDLSDLYKALLSGDIEVLQSELQKELQNTISYMDNKEAFYHGFLLGLFANLKREDYFVKSNREAGDGRYDICLYRAEEEIPPIIIELKHSKKYKDMEEDAKKALEQIEEKQYDVWLPEEGYTESIRYGIAFYKKRCRICMDRKTFD